MADVHLRLTYSRSQLSRAPMTIDPSLLERAAALVATADALVVGAGAGMGVDSGLPDFRGRAGFWRHYPPFAKLGLDFEQLANPSWFSRDPQLAWGFYGQRLHAYRATTPHAGFGILRHWASRCRHGAFVFTSNVDGQFQRAGFSAQQVLECHGSIHVLQCSGPCSSDVWSAEATTVSVDPRSCRAEPPLPRCPRCQALARPNILMFGDRGWVPYRTDEQEQRFAEWRRGCRDATLVVVELGAGTSVPTVRWTCERIAVEAETPLIRINPREAHGPPGAIGLYAGALEALQAIDARLATLPMRPSVE